MYPSSLVLPWYHIRSTTHQIIFQLSICLSLQPGLVNCCIPKPGTEKALDKHVFNEWMHEWGIDEGKLSFIQQAFSTFLLCVTSWTMPTNIWRSRTPRKFPKNSQFEKQTFCLLAVTQEPRGDGCSPAQGRRSPGPRGKGVVPGGKYRFA